MSLVTTARPLHCVLSAILCVAAYREPETVAEATRTDDHQRDGPVWFITMVIGSGCLALQPDSIASASKHDQQKDNLTCYASGCP